MSRFKPFARVDFSITNPKTGSSWKSPRKIKAFLDSGSSISIIPHALADEIKGKTGEFETVPARVETANGEKEAVAVRNARVCLQEVCYRGNVLISGGFTGDMLVGSDFLSRTGCRIDFRTRTLECSGKRIPFTMEK